jgi:hypothetical protein
MRENFNENAPNLDGIDSTVDEGTGGDANNVSSSGSEWHTGYIQGSTFENSKVRYKIINGRALCQGDIILARTPKEIERLSHKIVKGVGIRGERFRWPDNTKKGEIPYTIEPNFPKQDRVIKAIQHWESKTRIRFIKRTDKNAQYYPNYLTFMRYYDPTHPHEYFCASDVGMRGGQQGTEISDECTLGAVMHEIGHTVGLYHEQSRTDRDTFVKILWDNIEEVNKPQFDKVDGTQRDSDGPIVGDNTYIYDLCSIMHYTKNAFSKNGKPTIEVLLPSTMSGCTSIGQRVGLSFGDIAAIDRIYENRPAITVVPLPNGSLMAFKYAPAVSILYYAAQTSPNSPTWNKWTVQTFPDNWLTDKFPSGSWPFVIFPLVGPNIQYVAPFFFWIDDTNTLTYIHPTRGRLFIKERSEFPDKLGDPVAAQSLGVLEVFWVFNNESRELHHAVLYEDKNEMVTPDSLGGSWSPNSRPVIAEKADRTLEVFMIGQDNQLYHKGQNIISLGGPIHVTWDSDWSSLQGPAYGDPVVARNADGRLEVFVIGQDNQLFHRWHDYPNNTSQWSNWEPLMPDDSEVRVPPSNRPAVALNPDGRLELFLSVPTDGSNWTTGLLHTRQTSEKSSQWSKEWDKFATPHSLPLVRNPAISRNQDGRIELFVRSLDGNYYHRWQTSKNGNDTWDWSEWEEMK